MKPADRLITNVQIAMREDYDLVTFDMGTSGHRQAFTKGDFYNDALRVGVITDEEHEEIKQHVTRKGEDEWNRSLCD